MPPLHILSLLPGATEMVAALGCADRLVGRSHECDFPEAIRHLPVCTRTRVDAAASSGEIHQGVGRLMERALSLFELDLPLIRDLRPDLILTQAQCEVCAVSVNDVETALAGWLGERPRVLSFAPQRLADVFADLLRLGEVLDVADRARTVVAELRGRLSVIRAATLKRVASHGLQVGPVLRTGRVALGETRPTNVELTDQDENVAPIRPTVVCIEWFEPLMVAGNWVPELVEIAGGRDVLGKPGEHSPWIEWETIRRADPDVIILMPCGFDLARTLAESRCLQSRPGWSDLRAVRSGRVFAVDGNSHFNRPGPRLVESAEILEEILWAERAPVLRGARWEGLPLLQSDNG